MLSWSFLQTASFSEWMVIVAKVLRRAWSQQYIFCKNCHCSILHSISLFCSWKGFRFAWKYHIVLLYYILTALVLIVLKKRHTEESLWESSRVNINKMRHHSHIDYLVKKWLSQKFTCYLEPVHLLLWTWHTLHNESLLNFCSIKIIFWLNKDKESNLFPLKSHQIRIWHIIRWE